MTALEAVQLANTGAILWEALGPSLQRAMESGEDVDMDQVETASANLGGDLAALRAAIASKKARDQAAG